jgi:hypothetical protein
MTEKQLEALNEFVEVTIGVYGGCLTVANLKRTGNVLHNADNTISIDITTLSDIKGRSEKGLFKSIMTAVLHNICTQYPDSNACDKISWARSNGYKLFVEYNGRGMHPYNFKI